MLTRVRREDSRIYRFSEVCKARVIYMKFEFGTQSLRFPCRVRPVAVNSSMYTLSLVGRVGVTYTKVEVGPRVRDMFV